MRQLNLFSTEDPASSLSADISAQDKQSSFSVKDLNDAQFEAVTIINGPVLVIAGAGSGKTRTLVHRLAYLVEQGISPKEILLLTFTRKAAQEMTGRAGILMGEECRQVMGGTFHAMANLLLRRYGHHVGYAPNFTILDRSDAEGIVNLLKSSLDLTGAGRRFPRKQMILNIISGAVNKSMPFDDLVASRYGHLLEFLDDLRRIRDHYHQFKRDHGLMDYDDLLVYFRDVLAENDDVRHEVSNRFRYVMVDEYQDTNKIQAEIVRLIASNHNNVMVVGDDSQSIYSFRGADFRNIMDFPDIYAGTKIIRLEENYRSSQKILEATNAIIAQAEEKYTKKLFSSISGGDKPFLFAAKDEGEQARYVAGKIVALHDKGLAYHDMAVLFRSGFHSYKLELELTNRHIRFEKRGGMKLTETAHIKDVLAYLRLVCNSQDSLSWNRILLQLPKVGPKIAQKIVTIIRSADDPFTALRGYKAGASWKDDYREMVEMLSGLMACGSPMTKFEHVMEYYRPVFEHLYPDDYPRRARDLEQLKDIISEYTELQSFLDDTTLDPPGSVFDTDELEQDTLVLSTVHSAKGLEWDTVFVIHLADGKFPSSHSAAFPDQLEEERRLLYVAATRAKSQLFLTYPRETIAPDRTRQYSPISPFLAELPSGLIESLKGTSQSFYHQPDGSSFSFTAPALVSSKSSVAKEETAQNVDSGSLITNTKCLSVGSSVRHGFFGTGQVRKIKDEKTVDVFFPRHGNKILRLDYAKLEIC